MKKKKSKVNTVLTILLSSIWSFAILNCSNVCDDAVPATKDLVKVRFMSSLERLTKFQDFTKRESIELNGAKGEWVSLQLAVRAEKAFIDDLKLEITDFKDEKGYFIESSNFIRYREHFLEITKSSPESNLPTGWYPDPLIPFVNPETGDDLKGKYDAYPYKLDCGENVIYYVECKIPYNSIAGTYQGNVILNYGENEKLIYPVSLNVYKFSIPEQMILPTAFGGASKKFKEFYSVNLDEALHHFENFIFDHLLQPTSIYSVLPIIDKETGWADFANVHQRMQYLLDTLKIKYYPIPLHEDWPFINNIYMHPQKTINFLKSYDNYFLENGWNDRLILYLIDEPKEKDFYKVHDLNNVLIENKLSIKQLVTIDVIPEAPSWGGLSGIVDIWTPLFQYCDYFLESNAKKENDIVWAYTALCQIDKGQKKTPYWQIDFPLLNYRVPLWMMYKTDITGLLYWNTTHWNHTNDPWTNSLTYDDGDYEYNGDGSLLYPGSEVGYWGLCTSLRLKAIRDGVEDYYYLQFADSLGLLHNNIRDVATNWNNWNEDPNSLLKTREYIGDLISNAQ